MAIIYDLKRKKNFNTYIAANIRKICFNCIENKILRSTDIVARYEEKPTLKLQAKKSQFRASLEVGYSSYRATI